jgi:hypothetical protein
MKKPPSERSSVIRDRPISFLKESVIKRLEQAARLTPDDARIYVQLAWGTHQLWEAHQRRTRQELPLAEEALQYAAEAKRLDPHGSSGYLVEYRIRMSYADINEASAEELRKAHGDPVVVNDRDHTAREQYRLAAETLESYLPNDPRDAVLRYMIWRAWHKTGNGEKARSYAAEGLELDDLVTAPARKLEESQRKQLEGELNPPASAARH